ncbi:hypothetical protein BGX38DRAFT_1184188 [Terfezia claveryi]|nr:hypothetical protein BGX38DRAFT_1184188 [Terfezia claveryi]
MPSRSPADATRFTSTGPHASSSPHQFTRSATTTGAATANAAAGIAGVETPQKRIARLREDARVKKMENITLMDRLYVHGRVWADRAHRATAFGLIGATFLCGGATVFAFTQMIIHNRGLKKKYAEEAKRLTQLDPTERQQIEKKALIAAGGGPAAAALTPEEREQGRGIVANLKDWSVYGLTPAKDEYCSRWNKDGGADVVMEGRQTKWLPTKEGRLAEGYVVDVPEPGKTEVRVAEHRTGKEVVQGRGMWAGVLSWFGR